VQKVAQLSVLLSILLWSTGNAADCDATSTGIIPLYPSIFVPRTAEEQSAALAAVNSIPAGPTVLLGVGMSNARRVWLVFVDDAAADPLKNPDVHVVNAAQGGGSASNWAIENETKTWGKVSGELANAGGFTKADVSVIWFMIHNSINRKTVEEYSATLESDVRAALDLFETEFPNLKIVWIQTMIYAGYSTVSGNYEPFAFESGYVAQRLVADQSWPFFVGYGPYLWADGMVPRDDGLIWLCSDFADDGNHPDLNGQIKHSEYLLQFFHEDSVASIGYLDAGTLLTVPDVVGLDQATAEAAIISAGLVVGTVTTANDDTVPAGDVISQSPAGGTSAASGSAVDLVVSLGPVQLTTVPDVVGLDQATAEATIVSADLVVGTVTSTNDDTVPAGDVISQSPAGGTSAATGSPVDLVVSLGPVQMATVPDVENLDQATAEATIVSAGLVVGTVTTANDDTVPAGDVISQNPIGGTEVIAGTAVDLVVSLGPVQMTTVPDVVDLEQASAEASIASADLVVGTITTANSDTVVAGNVISQDPTGGTEVVTGTAVDLEVSLGPATGVPMIVSPVDGSTLSGSSETFTWSAEGTTVTNWRLEIGTTSGGTDLFRSGFTSTVTSQVVTGLPTDGSLVYVTLKWRADGVTSSASYVYTASGDDPPPAGTPAITSPVPGSTLSGESETFTWSAEGAAVTLEVASRDRNHGRQLHVHRIRGNSVARR
jgi:beta-lactam-binding protein with PASTA domain